MTTAYEASKQFVEKRIGREVWHEVAKQAQPTEADDMFATECIRLDTAWENSARSEQDLRDEVKSLVFIYGKELGLDV